MLSLNVKWDSKQENSLYGPPIRLGLDCDQGCTTPPPPTGPSLPNECYLD